MEIGLVFVGGLVLGVIIAVIGFIMGANAGKQMYKGRL